MTILLLPFCHINVFFQSAIHFHCCKSAFSGARLLSWEFFSQLYWLLSGWQKHISPKAQLRCCRIYIFSQRADITQCVFSSCRGGRVANSASIYLLLPRLQTNQSVVSFIFLRRQIRRIKSRKANPAAAQGKIKDSIWKFSSNCFGTNKNFLTKIKTCVGNVNLCLIFPFLLQHKNSVSFWHRNLFFFFKKKVVLLTFLRDILSSKSLYVYWKLF